MVELGQGNPHARSTRNDRDSSFGNRLHRRHRIKPLNQDHTRTGSECQPDGDVQSKDVIRGKHAEDHVAGNNPFIGHCLFDVGQQIAMRENRGLGRSCGTGSEHVHRWLMFIDFFNLHRLMGEQFVERVRTGELMSLCGNHNINSTGHRGVNLLPHGESCRLDHHRFRRDDTQLAFNLWCRTGGVQRTGNCSQTESRQIRHDEVPTVATQQRDDIPALHTQIAQRSASRGHLGTQCAI